MDCSLMPSSHFRGATRFFCAGALLFISGCAAYGPPRAGEKIYRNVTVSGQPGGARRMDLYVPKSPRPAPVVVWIFGGSWKFGWKGYHLSLRDLPQHGIALACIDYRLSDEAKYPAQLNDCRAEVDWLRANGARYGIDGSRLALSGESAGAHLAALLGLLEGKSRIKAVCAMYPPTDLLSLGRKYSSPKGPSAIERLLGGPIEQKLRLARDASPVDHVTAQAPPFLIFHGLDDTLVPPAQSEKLDRLLRKSGVESHLVLVPRKGHWFLLSDAEFRDALHFFERHFGTTKQEG